MQSLVGEVVDDSGGDIEVRFPEGSAPEGNGGAEGFSVDIEVKFPGSGLEGSGADIEVRFRKVPVQKVMVAQKVLV